MIFLGILAVSTASILIRFAQREAPSLVIAASRLSIAVILLTPIVWGRHRLELTGLKKGQLRLLFLSGIFLALHFASWILSLEFTTVVESVILVSTTPLWVSLLSPVLLQEKISRKVGIGMVITLLGAVLIAFSDVCQFQAGQWLCTSGSDFLKGRSVYGNLLALIGAWCAAGYILIGRKVRPTLSIVPYTYTVYGSAAVVLIAAVFATGQHFTGYSTNTYIYLLALGVVPQLLGHTSFNWALKYLPATFVSITMLGEPVGTSILALIFLGEKLTSWIIAGGVLIVSGILLVSRGQK